MEGIGRGVLPGVSWDVEINKKEKELASIFSCSRTTPLSTQKSVGVTLYHRLAGRDIILRVR